MLPTKFKDVIKNASRDKLHEDILLSMSDFVFAEVKKEMMSFENLSIYILGMVNWFYGKKRLEKLIERIDINFNHRREGTKHNSQSFIVKLSEKELLNLRQKVTDRLVQYEEYIKEKRETKTAYKEAKRIKNESNRKV